MTHPRPKINSGFSLIEISIVILVVGLIAAGAMSATRLVNHMLINTAREVTDSSPANYLRRDVIAWFDTVSANSFSTSSFESSQRVNDGTSIANWYETKAQTPTPPVASQSIESKKPIYSTGVINGLPALKFDGVDDLLSINTSYTSSNVAPSAYNNFSVFVVAQATSNLSFRSEASSGTSGQSGQRYLLFPPSGDVVYSSLYGSTASAGISFGLNGISFFENADSYTAPMMSSSSGYSPIVTILMEYRNKTPILYVNGKLVRTGLTSSKDYVFPPFYIGGGPSPWNNYGNFSGYIAEIIMFDKALTSEDRDDVFAYLKKKWKLKY